MQNFNIIQAVYMFTKKERPLLPLVEIIIINNQTEKGNALILSQVILGLPITEDLINTINF